MHLRPITKINEETTLLHWALCHARGAWSIHNVRNRGNNCYVCCICLKQTVAQGDNIVFPLSYIVAILQ